MTHKIQEIITEGNNEESQTICNHETSPSGLLGTPKSLSPTGSHDGHLHSHNALPDALHLSEFMDVDEEYFHESEATCSYTDVESFTPGEDTSERSKNQSFIDPEEGENADAGKKQACLRCRFQKQKVSKPNIVKLDNYSTNIIHSASSTLMTLLANAFLAGLLTRIQKRLFTVLLVSVRRLGTSFSSARAALD